jgi:tetratricopeptide (TPR) repeat protein
VQYLLSIGYLKQSKRDKARETITRLFAELTPGQAHLLAGRAYYESTLFEEALVELTKARDLDPALQGVWRELGKTQVSLRRSAEARTSLTKAVQLQPDDVEAAYFLGALLVQEGAIEEGVPFLERARAARPGFVVLFGKSRPRFRRIRAGRRASHEGRRVAPRGIAGFLSVSQSTQSSRQGGRIPR